MQVILSHAGADFDAFASMVAASKLYPGARLFFSGSPEPNVREFASLHRSQFPVDFASEHLEEDLELAVLVDTREPTRLGPFRYAVSRPEVKVHVYDHHPATPESVAGDLEVVEPLGASVTVVLKRVLDKGLDISPLEATLFLLGIYEETGSLTFPDTTSEDIRMAARLLDLGGNLSLVPHFVQHSLNEGQRNLLAELLRSCRVEAMRGYQVMVATGHTDSYVDELAVLTHRLMDLERPDVLFTVVRMGKRTYVVGRAAANTADVGRVLGEMGGGGHPTAASASLKGREPEEVAQDLLVRVRESLPKVLTARDLMSWPVHCLEVKGRVTVSDAGDFLRRIGHSAACVQEGKKIVGMIARSDVDKALAHELGHAPVHAYMTREVLRVAPDTPLPEIQRLLVENDIGRLPVMDGPKLVGIVSRSDVLRALHGSCPVPPAPPDPTPAGLLDLDPELLALLRRCGAIGQDLGVEVYAVGGFVRDLLLGVPNYDVDLVVEGAGIPYAEALRDRLGGRCSSHEKFGTAVVTLPGAIKIDVATARTEMYTRPAALPVVRGSTLKQDLYRRDFSINAMALRLQPEKFGRLVDFFGAQRDLQAGLVRVLHNLSFVDDPTRIFRAIKFEQRYGFRMDPNTEHLLKSAVSQEMLAFVSPERVRDEVIQILSEPRPLPSILRMDRLKVLRLLHPRLQADDRVRGILEETEEVLGGYGDLVQSGELEPWVVWLSSLLSGLDPRSAKDVADRYKIRSVHRKKLELDRRDAVRRIRVLGRPVASESQVFRACESLSVEAAVYLAARSKSRRARQRIQRYLRVLRHVEPPLTGADLKGMGYAPGPQFRDILEWLRDRRLDGRILTRDTAARAVAQRWPIAG